MHEAALDVGDVALDARVQVPARGRRGHRIHAAVVGAYRCLFDAVPAGGEDEHASEPRVTRLLAGHRSRAKFWRRAGAGCVLVRSDRLG